VRIELGYYQRPSMSGGFSFFLVFNVLSIVFTLLPSKLFRLKVTLDLTKILKPLSQFPVLRRKPCEKKFSHVEQKKCE
jgi:hypothetical protein